jgi:hypothetical protein
MKRILFVAALFSSAAAFAQVDTTSENVVTTDSSSNAVNDTQANDSTAQSSSNTSGISDEDLKKYAVTMDSVNGMKQTLLTHLAEKLRNNTKNVQVSRYNELYKIIDDEAKLAEAKATPEEIAFVKEVDQFKDQGAAQINAQFQALAKDYVGVSTFNKIKNSLATDNELKARYDQILSQVETTSGTASAK